MLSGEGWIEDTVVTVGLWCFDLEVYSRFITFRDSYRTVSVDDLHRWCPGGFFLCILQSGTPISNSYWTPSHRATDGCNDTTQ